MKLNFLKLYETFHKEYFDKLIADDKTYIDKDYEKKPINVIDIERYNTLCSKIRKYDISKFSITFTYVRAPELIIKPDQGFIQLIQELNEVLVDKVPLELDFEFSIFVGLINRIDFKEGIPIPLRNMKLGYKLYKLIIHHYKYITSKIGASDDAKKIWYYLMQDSELFCFTSNNISGVILKNCSDEEIKEFLTKLDGYPGLEFDEELQQKIKELKNND